MSSDNQNFIRNFCIIAHIDHGKSTLADRMIELTHTVAKREMRSQLLDSMDLERERGITIKLQPVRMQWESYQLNLIDTPGHIDFNYEVSRSLAAVEGAILLVDATQGIQAQTLANLYLAIDQNLTIIPVINKIDLPAADVAKAKREIIKIVGCKDHEIISLSAKTGEGVEYLLNEIIRRIPPPKKDDSGKLRALIFDAHYNEFKGVVIYVRIFSGDIYPQDNIRFLKGRTDAEVIEVGFFKPQWQACDQLSNGMIGYIVTNIKDLEQTKVGDTITRINDEVEPLTGYKEVKPMVFAGIYPADGAEHVKLRKAIYKLKLNDASLEFTPDHSDVLGFGFRCGFLGLLHLEIFQERLKREFNLNILVTSPTVAYKIFPKSGKEYMLTMPSLFPEENAIEHIEQPVVSLELFTPKEYLGQLMDYIQKKRGTFSNTEFFDETRVILRCRIPLSNIIVDFYDKIKNISSGYASYTYEFTGYDRCSLVKLEILIAEEKIPALTSIVPRDEAQNVARTIVLKLKQIIPKAQFVIKIQAALGGKIIAAERISALRKDVTAKLYGGDVTRKRKLLEKQKKGKKKMAMRGSVQIPSKAYLAILKRD